MADLSFLDGRGEDFGFLGTLSTNVAIVLVPVTHHGPGRARLCVFARFGRSGISPASGIGEHASHTDQESWDSPAASRRSKVRYSSAVAPARERIVTGNDALVWRLDREEVRRSPDLQVY